MDLRARLRNSRFVFCVYNRLLGRNRFAGTRGNTLDIGCARLDRVRVRMHGTGNVLRIADGCVLRGCTFDLSGDGNRVLIGKDTLLLDLECVTEDAHNTVSLGAQCAVLGRTHLAAIEGTRIDIGPDCMFGDDVQVRTGDSHSLVDENGQRVNPSRDVVIGPHVWLCARSICLKGTHLGEGCVLGTCAVASGDLAQPHCVLAGIPARVTKTGITWKKERIPVRQEAPETAQGGKEPHGKIG